jgi:hypothetical protein
VLRSAVRASVLMLRCRRLAQLDAALRLAIAGQRPK